MHNQIYLIVGIVLGSDSATEMACNWFYVEIRTIGTLSEGRQGTICYVKWKLFTRLVFTFFLPNNCQYPSSNSIICIMTINLGSICRKRMRSISRRECRFNDAGSQSMPIAPSMEMNRNFAFTLSLNT